MFVYLLLLFTLVPLLEIVVLLKVGSWIGSLNTILLVISTGLTGAYYARQQGLAVMGEIKSSLNSGQMPGDALIHGLLVLIGGITLITPGFLTDLLGLSLLFPFTRIFYVRHLKRYFSSRFRPY